MKKSQPKTYPLPDNESEFDHVWGKAKDYQQFQALLRLIAQALDLAIQGDNVWISIGTTRDRSSIVLSVHQSNEVMAVYSDTFLGIVAKAGELL